ncbi:MAG: LPXTG cell wall anchor domain-containing protein [Sphingomonadales bacterium]|nr:LPXTG cell wall anchor domain-containing protein [Sphingomonadales bacterium]
MTKNAPLLRPATSAIAAFLVLTTPAAFAQEAPTIPMSPPVSVPPTSAPPTVQPPATTAPATAPTAQPAPSPVIRVPLDLPPVPEAKAEAAPAPRARAERAAPRQRAATPAPVARAAAPAETVTAAPEPAEEIAPVAAPVAAIEPVAEAAPAPVAKAPVTGGDSFPWEIAGGAAALLIAGGAGLAFARRRRATKEVWEFDESASNAEWVPTAEPAPEPAFAAREEIAPAPEPRSQPTTTPTFAAAPSGSMGRHEAMAMAGPTPENPFATLSKRLARARFLDRQERAEYDAKLTPSEAQVEPALSRKPVSAWEISQRQAPAAPAEQEVRRLQPGSIRKDLKPGWTRS